MNETMNIQEILENFVYCEKVDLSNFMDGGQKTVIEEICLGSDKFPKYINEFWTSRQRTACSVHEISYRACFKAQLPGFFINRLTKEGETVYDPFSGRGTTIVEAALLNRNVISNDVNPLSEILTRPRIFVPDFGSIKERLQHIPMDENCRGDIDLSMFYHPGTESEIVSLRNYLQNRKKEGEEDDTDRWIRMVATNRLTGHSSGFFSVYSLPPNQAVSQESQVKINIKRDQKPEYRDTRKIILKKTKSLLRSITDKQLLHLETVRDNAKFLTKDAGRTPEIENKSVKLTVTSPPFLDIVQYSKDNWLRCWFNSLDTDEISKKITMAKTIEKWSDVMAEVFRELFRITSDTGHVAFEVGEVRKGKIKLDEYVIPLGISAGFECEGVVINQQEFTKTSNIWGIDNLESGTNTNRIVLFKK